MRKTEKVWGLGLGLRASGFKFKVWGFGLFVSRGAGFRGLGLKDSVYGRLSKL